GLRSFAFDTDGLDAADGEGRLGVKGLHGGLDWNANADRPATTLSWQALQVYRMPHGPAQMRWQSRSGALSLQHSVDIPLLNGRVHVGD
ncbi:hypothetical protein ACFKP0_25135, partial [Salmonella enterica subsp. enterica serovar Soahanina]